MRMSWDVRGDAGEAGSGFDLRQLLGRVLLCGAVVCFVAGLPWEGARAASTADRDAGAQIFKDKGCEHCHGVDGAGTERGPALRTVGKQMHRDQIAEQIRQGGKQMPPFGDVLSEDEMRKLVDYLAHKKKAPNGATGS